MICTGNQQDYHWPDNVRLLPAIPPDIALT